MAAPYSDEQRANDNYAHHRIPGGRPVPTFYSPDGKEVPHPNDEHYVHEGAAPVPGFRGKYHSLIVMMSSASPCSNIYISATTGIRFISNLHGIFFH